MVKSCKASHTSICADFYRPVNVCVATPHTVHVVPSIAGPSYGFAGCAAMLDVTSAAFPTGLRQDPLIDLPVKELQAEISRGQKTPGSVYVP